MCRTDLGECIGEGCTARATCQDNHGWCNEHTPYRLSWCECEDDCGCAEPPPSPPVNEIKQLRYRIPRMERHVQERTLTASRAKQEARVAAGQLRDMRKLLALLVKKADASPVTDRSRQRAVPGDDEPEPSSSQPPSPESPTGKDAE